MKTDVCLLLAATLAPIVGGSSSGLIVHLDYSTYQGYHEASTGLNIWKGYAVTPQPAWNAANAKLTSAAFGMHRLLSGSCDGSLHGLQSRITVISSMP